MNAKAPLILTLALDEAAHDLFTALRNKYFPKYCNYLSAHLTLFHHLPENVALIDEVLQEQCRRNILTLEVTGIKNMGNGVAFTIASAELQAMHKAMQQQFEPYLISQDRKALWPHITIQNKVTAYKAKQTTDILLQEFKPFTIQGTGITSWLYLNGPWAKKEEYKFKE